MSIHSFYIVIIKMVIAAMYYDNIECRYFQYFKNVIGLC